MAGPRIARSAHSASRVPDTRPRSLAWALVEARHT